MHDFQRVARAHNEVFRRQKDEDDDEKTTSSSSSASRTTPTPTTARSTSTTSSSTSSSARTTSSESNSGLNLSTLLGGSTSSKTSTTSSSSSTESTSSTTSLSTTTSHSGGQAVTQTFTSIAAASATASESSAKASGGLSGTATGGIIAGCVLAGLALLIFAIRKTFIRRRQRKRNTWGAGMFPDINDKYSVNNDLPPPIPEKATSLSPSSASPRTPVWAPARPMSPNPSGFQLAPPTATYNNPMMDAVPTLPPPMAMADPVGFRPGTTASNRPASSAHETATVRVIYIPTLPDELSISAGEIVTVIKAYDDGWALCQNSRGEQGVCPLECLDRSQVGNAMIEKGVKSDAVSVHSTQPQDADWRNVKRLSSLSSQQPHY